VYYSNFQSISQLINQLNLYSAPYKTLTAALNNVHIISMHINVNRVPNSNKSMLKMNNIKHVTSINETSRSNTALENVRQRRMSRPTKRRRLGRRRLNVEASAIPRSSRERLLQASGPDTANKRCPFFADCKL